jgi:hypothetical protein
VAWIFLAAEADKALRWIEGQPGCTFSADDDGMYRYGLWTDDFRVILAVDSDELRKAVRRTEPTFTVFLTVRYRGQGSMALDPGSATLEFVKHDHDLHSAIVPGDLSLTLQKDADRFAEKVQREINKHPEKKSEEEALLQEKQKDVQEAIEFLQRNSLVSAQLNPGHADASGWLYFQADGKWIGDWKKQEEIVLRIPLANRIIEFPFALPPSSGDLILRRRPNK